MALAHHQLVAQEVAQTPERIADGRLGDRQVVGGAREVALGHDFVEDPQQIQIKGAEVK